MTLTPELFDTLIVVVVLVGLALAAVRLYADFTRPLPDERRFSQPNLPKQSPENTPERTQRPR